MSLNGFLGGAMGAFGPSPLQSQQRGDPLAQLLGQYRPGAIVPVNSQADYANALYAKQTAQAINPYRALRDRLDLAPSVEAWIPLEERWKREAEAEAMALCPVLADSVEPILPEVWWLRFLRWLRDILPVSKQHTSARC